MLLSHRLLVSFSLLLTAGLAPAPTIAQISPTTDTDQQTLRQELPQTQAEAHTAEWFEAIRHRPTQLRAFIQRLPKGGDIHTHLSGAVYAESYLEWAAANGYCVDTEALAMVAPADCAVDDSYVAASTLLQNSGLYNALVNQWSTRNLAFEGQSGHDQFFEAFGGFGEISDDPSLKDDMVAEVANRAAAQHISYLELMLTFQSSPVRRLGRELGLQRGLAETQRLLLADPRFQALLQQGMADVEMIDAQRAATLGCGTATAQPGCDVTVRFLQQTTRLNQPEEVFAQFVYAFELARADPRVVGINLVAPEDHPVALRDYTQQMEMLGFLHRQDESVNIALHAGELTLGLVPPADLRFHIRQAVEVAGARRIGHGVDIFYEDNPWQLLQVMADRGVLVEICLTSNDVILGVSGADHPFPDYWNAGVPVTLASDDEGISRIDLSHEYWRAATTYNLGYPDLKKLARNSLEYSFLPGSSLWQSPDFTDVVEVCAGDAPGSGGISQPCADFLDSSDRARQQWQLEADFSAFEHLVQSFPTP
jgi:hypothetical protein